MLSDLRESDSLEQDVDLVILLNRPDLYDRDSERAGEADFRVAKHRNGLTKATTVAFQGHYSALPTAALRRWVVGELTAAYVVAPAIAGTAEGGLRERAQMSPTGLCTASRQ